MRVASHQEATGPRDVAVDREPATLIAKTRETLSANYYEALVM